MSSRTRIILAQGALLLAFAPTLSGQQDASTSWQLKGARLKLASDTIIYERKESPPVAVAANSITSVCYDTATHARGLSAWQATKEMGSANDGLILAPFVLPVVAGVHASKSTQHFITLHWAPPQPDRDSMRTLTLEAEKGNFAALLKEIQQVTGKPWTDVSQHRNEIYARVGSELKSAEKEKHAPYLAIKETSRIGSSILDPSFYRAVLRAGSSGEGNLYVFEGPKKERLVAIVHVSVREEKNGDSHAVPIYGSQADPWPKVAEIRMPNRTLTVTASQPYDYDADCPTLP